MNTSNKTLLQILVQELPKRGGWPETASTATQDSDGEICFSSGGKHEYCITSWKGGKWTGDGFMAEHAIDYEISIITREQYEAALAASKELRPYQVSTGHYTSDAGAGKTASAADADGWIDWHGGECPVDSDAIVEVKYRKPNPYQFNNERAGDVAWSHDGFDGDIIAYRLSQPHEVKTAGIDVKRDAVNPSDAQLEADLNDCIGQPQEDIKTIRAEMMEILNSSGMVMKLSTAMKLVDVFIDAGYRKQ